MKYLAVILLVALLADDPPKSKKDTLQCNKFIAVQEEMMSDLDSISYEIAAIQHKLDSLKKK